MSETAPYLLIGAVAAVGILHTIVPDHWVPISVLARQQGWTRSQLMRAAALAGIGHTVSTLLIAVLVWAIGLAVAMKFGSTLNVLSSAALIVFGAWISLSALREMREHGHAHLGHVHPHRHADGAEHRHYHEHDAVDWHVVDGSLAIAPMHVHEHKTSSRTALLLIVGSSPMMEGIPAFFAAARYGFAQLTVMAGVFAVSTIATYIAMCLLGTTGLRRAGLGNFEKYGEVLSGAVIALIGIVFILLR